MDKNFSVKVKEINDNKINIKTGSKFRFHGGEDEKLAFISDNGDFLLIESEHSADCCEYNYIAGADLGETLITEIFTDIFDIEFIDEFGININGNPIPCYSVQNGHYSHDVDLYFTFVGKDKNPMQFFSMNLNCELRYE